ncbi:MAG: phosphoribosyl-ATP diphosphatase [Alphaproteobacteria bacterium]
MAASSADSQVLDRLFAVIEARRGADPASSYTAKLLAGGAALPARKLGEESIETVIAALQGDRAALANESADLLYHLLVLWAASGLRPADVYAVLGGREGLSGLAEKAAREKSS